jgi:hypothetical protein
MRNSLAGSRKGKSKSAKYYQENPDAKKKKDEYNTEYHSTPARKKYRAALQELNRDKGTHGNKDGMDEAHVSKTKTKKQSQSKNRADKKRKFFK